MDDDGVGDDGVVEVGDVTVEALVGNPTTPVSIALDPVESDRRTECGTRSDGEEETLVRFGSNVGRVSTVTNGLTRTEGGER